MTSRDKSKLQLLILVGGFFVVVVAAILAIKATNSLNDQDGQITALNKEIEDLEGKRMLQAKARKRYEEWRAISLPPDESVAKAKYKLFLSQLAREHRMFLKSPPADSGRGGVVSNKGSNAVINPLVFNMTVEATLAQLVAFLHDFYTFNLPHTIRTMSIARMSGDNENRLEVQLKMEVLSLPNAANRDFLVALPGPSLLAVDVFTALKGGPYGLALGPWLASPTGAFGSRKLAELVNHQRDYKPLAYKNVFVGLAPPSVVDRGAPGADRDILKFVQLTGITSNIFATEALLINRRTGKVYTLRAEGGFDSFEIYDRNNLLVMKGTVKAVADHDMVIQVEGKYYGVHIGEFLEQALSKTLTAAELKEFGLTAETTEAEAQEKEKPGEP